MDVNIIPTGGLCNRLRAIATAVTVADKLNGNTIVHWNNDNGLRADFSDLFMPIEKNNVKIIENKKWLYKIESTKGYYMRKFILDVLFEQVVFNFSIYRNNEDIYTKLKPNYQKGIMLISCYPMCKEYNLTELFVPQKHIMNKIDNITKVFTSNTIGVHIRRTDNITSIKMSPTEAFVKIMDREIQKNKDVTFYLASDDKAVKQEMVDRYPQKIITCWDETERNSIDGMIFAVVDLYCLSRTSKIIGSTYSSYSQVACELGNIDIEYAKM